MKVVSTDGLTELIQLSKDNFIDKNDVIDMTSVFATVATTGAYSDLTGQPTIPTVNDATITITQGGTTKGTFTLNQTNNDTIALDAAALPTQTGNGGKFLTTDGTDASWADALTPNTAITGATKCKITYDSKGLVTAGSDLQASDIPSLTLSKISDITATASELNVLDGITASTTELNYIDGVTSSIQTQLDNKVEKNNAITGATKCKITYDSKGLVTSGTNLEASDIPSLTLSKISDITATASELNILDGITATTTELNYIDGVTSSIQTQLDNKVAKTTGVSKVYGTDSSGAQTTYDVSSFGAVDDVKVGTNSVVTNKVATLGTMAGEATSSYYTKTEIDGIVSSVYKPAGSVAYASLPTPASTNLGNVYNVTDAFTTDSRFVDGSGNSYPAGTNVVVIDAGSSTYKFDVLSGFVDLSGYVPTSRKVNNKALTADISLLASDVGAQETLVSGTNIKTVNNTSLLGSGNITIDSLPSQTGNSGKFLTTDGTAASWGNAVVANTAITGATHTKITYDSKGLVTAGADLAIGDIPDLTSLYQSTFTLNFAGNWTGGLHLVKFLTVDYTTCDSEHGVFIKISMVNSHGNGITGRFYQDATFNVTYTGDVSGTIYRYFAETVEFTGDYQEKHYGDIFWTIDTENKIVKFFILMRQYSYTFTTPYFRLNASTKGVITQSTGAGNEEYSSGTQHWLEINDLENIPTEATISSWGFTKNVGTVTSVNNVSPDNNGNVSIDSLPSQTGNSGKYLTTDGTDASWASISIPTVNNATLTITQGGATKGTFTANASSDVTIALDSSGGSVDIDNKSITTNSSDELQTVGVINQNNTTTAIKTWSGTKAQYDVLVNNNTVDSNTLYNITDDVILANYANTDLSNLTSTGKNISNWSSNATNCLTEIPQDIKLELNNGTLTLKTGSKVYIPNGFNNNTPKFDEVITSSDITVDTYTSVTDRFIFLSGNAAYGSGVTNCYSGNTATMNSMTPAAYKRFYNTETNKVYWGGINGDAWVETPSCLPLAIVQHDSSGNYTKIDQVFNGFGYIGSTIFVLPNVKGLIPNGRNDDGTLKTTSCIINSVQTYSITSEWGTGTEQFFINGSNLNLHRGIASYFICDTEPTVTATANYWYSPLENILRSTSDTGSTWTQITGAEAVKISFSSGSITSISPKTAFRAVDYNDLSSISANTNLSNLSATGQAIIDAKANDSDVVKLTGNQTINGTKTFNNIIVSNSNTPLCSKNSNYTIGTTPASSTDRIIVFQDSAGTNTAYIQQLAHTDGWNHLYLSAKNKKSDNTIINTLLDIRAKTDGTREISGITPSSATDNSTKIATTAWKYNNDNTLRTNCILEIPQNIKLELNAGTLTLKVGSKVYAPNGSGVFDVITISADKTETGSSMGLTTGSALVFARTDTQDIWAEVLTESGTGTPTNPWTTYYNTNDNKVYRYSTSITTPVYQGTLPVAKISFSDGTVTSIDHVFNGYGFIGSTVYVLPGVKGVIPNGRNDDGSLKNIIYTVQSISTNTNLDASRDDLIYVASTGDIGRWGMDGGNINYVKRLPDGWTSPKTYCKWYEEQSNLWWATGNSTTFSSNVYMFPLFTVRTDANKKITALLDTVDSFHAVDFNDIGNGTITITQGGTTKGTFTTNQKGDTTINLDAGSSGNYVSKSGDTMTGTLSAPGVKIVTSAVTKGTAPSSTQYMQIPFNDSTSGSGGTWQSTRLGILELTVGNDGSNEIAINAVQNAANSSTSAKVWAKVASDGTKTGGFPNTYCCDGQWVAKTSTIASDVSGKNTYSNTFSLSSILPSDNYNYECMLTAIGNTGTSSGNIMQLWLSTSIVTNVLIARQKTLSGSRMEGGGTAIVPVGTNRNLKLDFHDCVGTTGGVTLKIIAYRRIGTNNI